VPTTVGLGGQGEPNQRDAGETVFEVQQAFGRAKGWTLGLGVIGIPAQIRRESDQGSTQRMAPERACGSAEVRGAA
jgi:hypothetical protein